MEALALVLAATLAQAAPAAPKETVKLRIHAFRASVWVTIDADGRFKLKEELPEDVVRRPRRASKRLGKSAVAKFLRDAETTGFFELDERYVESGNATTSYRLEITGPSGTRAVSVYGIPPAGFQSLLDHIESLYGKPLLPDLARGAVRPQTPAPATLGTPSNTPKDDRSKKWSD